MSLSARRAWIEIIALPGAITRMKSSLSARRAWIEIALAAKGGIHDDTVALRKESVDRNLPDGTPVLPGARSLSARRAWIEIGAAIPQRVHVTQSLSARRAWIEI